MTDVNTEFLDALIRHQIGLLRVAGSIRKRILALLDATEADIESAIKRRLANAEPGLSPRNVERLRVLSRIISKIRAESWAEVDDILLTEMRDIATNEAQFLSQAITAISPVVVDVAMPDTALLKALVTTNPFEGRVMKQWTKDLAREDIRRINDAIKIGMVQGESNQDIAARVVGTVRANGTDGATELSRNQLTALSRTAVNHFANAAKREFYKKNQAILNEELFVATLDARTTPVCRANDGKTFPVGKGPIPPLHFNCRSTRVPVIDGDALGLRPAKPFTEAQLVREYSGGQYRNRDQLPRGEKSKYDKFARKRIRELTGRVPESQSYQVWLKRQSKSFQNEILGLTRARLFRDGGLTLDKFVNRRGDEIPLRELARRESAAFRAAGLNPEVFR
jgi:SPP1 gp7 family putative phage head morphogenesis protein